MNFETWLRSDLTKPLKVETLNGVFFSADNAANIIGVDVYDDGAAVNLSGSCVGYAIRADGGTLPITGRVSGNKASITLPASAYVIEGPLDIVIKVVSGSVKTTVGACRGYVQRATTDTIIDPGHVIPSLEELLALIEPMEEATDAANAAAASANNAASNANSKATAANTAATNANEKATIANTAATNANAARDNANTAAAAANAAAAAAPTQITNQATTYQNSTSGTVIPTGTWQTTQPDTPQGQFLWIRTILTWNNNQTTTLYSVSRMGIDGGGSVVSVNGIRPDANGNVSLPIDATPTQGSQNPVTSGGTYAALADKQDALTFDSSPTSGSTNPVTSGGVYTALSGKQNTLTFDTTPTSGSGNPVTSGGVYNAEQSVRNTIAIVATGTTAPQAITSGQYVIWNGSLYTATANIPSGGTLSTSNLQAVENGGVNALNSKIIGRKPATLSRPITGGNRTTDWTYTAPHDGTLYLVFAGTVRSYCTVKWNNADIGAVAFVDSSNNLVSACTMTVNVKKNDTINVVGLKTNCYLIASQTAFIANGVDV